MAEGNSVDARNSKRAPGVRLCQRDGVWRNADTNDIVDGGGELGDRPLASAAAMSTGLT
jgi:hypothetical protein